MLEAAAYDLMDERAVAAIERIGRFHQTVAAHGGRYFPSYVMNDGAVAYRDLSPRSRQVTYDFVARAFALFQAVNRTDTAVGGFGGRMVIAAGFRLRREIDFTTFLSEGKAKSIKARLANGAITPEQAVNEALMSRNTQDAAPELQANFAMTRAYLAEASGTKGGFAGPNCFVDLDLFTSPLPPWLKVRRTFTWADRGISARFGEIESIDGVCANAVQFDGALDAFGVAQRLSPSPDAGEKMKALRIVGGPRIGLSAR
jgi:hypothetical protein